jgi:hypothetical protein
VLQGLPCQINCRIDCVGKITIPHIIEQHITITNKKFQEATNILAVARAKNGDYQTILKEWR